MIFSRSRNIELPEPLIISDTLVEHKRKARFLGVIMDESLNWSSHVKAIQSKMSCYVGIMYKIKKFLPLQARLQIYHSFVQSHVNYCSLIWGFQQSLTLIHCSQSKKRPCGLLSLVLLITNLMTVKFQAIQKPN